MIKTVIALSALLAFPTAASAQIVVFGQGAAATCYQSTMSGNTGSSTAIRTCTEALAEPMSRSDEAATYVNRGVLHMRAGRQTAASQDYETALALDDTLSEAYVNYGASLIYQNRTAEALTALNIAVETIGDDKRPEALFNRALAYDRLENYTAAWRDLRTALALRPDWEPAVNMISRYSVSTSAPAG